MTTRRRLLGLAATGLAMPALPRLSRAQGWPARPIRAIIPFQAGTTVDIVGRIVLDPLSSQLGQAIVVENRGGAGGTLGAAAVAKAEPDGYTILVNASAHSAAPAAYPNIPYDTATDFAAVIPFGTVANVTVIAPARGIRSLQDLVAAAKSGQMSYASGGIGSATHWAAERLRVSAGFSAVHVPFRGGPDALIEVATGRVDFACFGIAAVLPFVHDGKLLPLAVNSAKRTSALPSVTTTLEAGYADFRLQLLGRNAGAGEDAARHRRSAARRDPEGTAPSQRDGEIRPAGNRAAAARAGGVRRADSQGDRRQYRAREGGRTKVQLNATRLLASHYRRSSGVHLRGRARRAEPSRQMGV